MVEFKPRKLKDLTEGDLAMCKVVAGIRTASARMAKTDRPFNTNFETHMAQEEAGVIAEYAFCKQYNLFFNMAMDGKDSGYDCVISKKRVDIKSIRERHKNLVVKKSTKLGSVDMYILIYVEGVSAEIFGWEHAQVVLDEKNLKDTGGGPVCFFIDKEKLRNW